MKSVVVLLSFGASLSLGAAQFQKPVQVKAGGKIVETESPGFAAPCLHDLDGDGKKDLLVGQFNDGKIKVYPRQGGGTFGAGKWLEVGDWSLNLKEGLGKKMVPATIPGVW